MAEKNSWRTVNKKGGGKKDNWRSKGESTENRFFSRTGCSNGNLRDQIHSKPTNNSTINRPIDIKSNNLLNPNFLKNLTENQSIEEITMFMMSNMEDYTKTLASNNDMSNDLLIALLKLGARACENPFVSSKTYMLKSTLQKNFVTVICSFLSGLLLDDKKDEEFWQSFGNVLNDLLRILENAMQFIPITLFEQTKTIVKTVTLVLPVLQNNRDITLTEDFNSRMAVLKDNLLKIEKRFKRIEPTVIQNSDEYRSEQGDPDDDYRLINLYPTCEELTIPERPYLRTNIVKGQYDSLQQYLDIHFRLMREDFLNPIREDICDYLNNAKRRFFNIKVHENVVFRKRDVQKDLVCYEIALNVSQSLRNMIETNQSKRFMHGTLLIFSMNNFKSIICGKVVNTDKLKEGILLINIPHNDSIIDYTKKYSMIECVIFFEPYYQVLKVLQRLSQNQLPMQKYILSVQTNISHPKYMENVRNFDFPSNLNSSQIKALNAALNKEFVIIQGPPGTGKTFLGMTLVKMLLQQRQFWKKSGPILVICFTNHALEQFLDGINNFTNKLVRLGRNSTDLYEIKLKYGPEGQLRTFLEENIYNSRSENYNNLYNYKPYDDDEDDEVYFGNEDEFDMNFRKLIGYIKHDFRKKPRYTMEEFYKIDPYSIPHEIIELFRYKNKLTGTFNLIKSVENDIKDVRSKMELMLHMEKVGIIVKVTSEREVEYYFQNIELFCWLLCEDGTISNEAKNDEEERPKENSALEQEKIYNLLSNVVLWSSEDLSFLSTNGLNQAAHELTSYLTSKDVFIKETDRQYLNEQIDFLLRKIDYLKLCLETNFGPAEVEIGQFPDPFMIQSIHRWQLYKQWCENYKTNLTRRIQELSDSYQRLFKNYNDLKEMYNVKLLQEVDIVGMTTTCAARLRPTLEALKCPIVIVEEAAEVLESHIIATLTKDCQHLILLGDHQQLRPTTSDFTIEKKYKLGISLFERMVQNNVECHTLNVQHRMRPEISSLITPLFYKELFNSETVTTYPLVSGIDRSLYFIDHMEPEEPYGDSSKMNIHEAKFLIKLAIYLLNNDYKPEDITILAAYLGQSYVLKKEQEKEETVHPDIGKVRITVVDNFQGEENKIILLSLVRSNSENKVGFLKIDNRVCVALSRAKVGMYIMGNMTQLCDATDIWKSIRKTLESQQAIGRYLALRCKNHSEHVTFVSKATDFVNVPEGGCTQTCNTILNCGHRCDKQCHGYDIDHELYNCKEPCTRLLCDREEHKCKKQCFDACGSCHYLVNTKLICGHEKILACSTKLATYKCMELIEIQLDCGHLQNAPCYLKNSSGKKSKEYETDTKETEDTGVTPLRCKFVIETVVLKCGHTQTVPCSELETYKCQYELEIILKCGHKIKKHCYLEENTIECSVICDKPLQCEHKCGRKCHTDDDPGHLSYRCLERCTKNQIYCNNPEIHPKCQLPCGLPCSDCKKIVMKSYTTCLHIEKLKCYEANEFRKCHNPCSKMLSCGHRCQNKCFELCSFCEQVTIKKIPECGHNIKLKCAEIPNQKKCEKSCAKTLECGHSCTNRCNQPCSEKCLERCQKVLDCGHKCIKKCHDNCACKTEVVPECGHSILIKCGDLVSSEKCILFSKKRLNCGHEKKVPCNKPISEAICEVTSRKTLPCGHTSLGKCNESIKCWKRCEKLLECGHKCTKACYEPCNKECMERCHKNLECGHPCQARCSQKCTPVSKCLLPCEKILKCNHKCKKRCYQSCTETCSEQCESTMPCGHKCSNTCSDECNTVCEANCGKRLDCGHKCRELCGKPCLEFCERHCKKILSCGHRCSKKCSEACDTECKSECGKLLECGHTKCQNLCGQPCTQACERPCRKKLECGHSCQERCGDVCTPLSQCRRICGKALKCEHKKCTNLCNEPCEDCARKCNKKLDCGHICINNCNEKCACSLVKSSDCPHYVRTNCGETSTKLNCTQLCRKLLECGHICKLLCKENCICLESCRKRLKCGCLCIKLTCSEPCECKNKCDYKICVALDDFVHNLYQ